jgi:hypothetical protein
VRASKKKKKHASRGLVNAGTSAKNSFGGRAIVDAGIHSVGGSRVQAEFCGFGVGSGELGGRVAMGAMFGGDGEGIQRNVTEGSGGRRRILRRYACAYVGDREMRRACGDSDMRFLGVCPPLESFSISLSPRAKLV